MQPQISQQLKPFFRRVRLARAWRGLAVGACLGALGAAVWAGLDWANLVNAKPIYLGGLVGTVAVLGGLIGACQKISEKAISNSVDRRANLDNRLTAAVDYHDAADELDQELQTDAASKLTNVRPAALYPMRLGKWHAGAVVFSAIAASIFLLGNSPVLLSPEAKKNREELIREGKKIERITKETFDDPKMKEKLSESEKRMADELRKLQKDLEKARMSKEEVLQKENELQQQAEQLRKDAAQSTLDKLAEAESAQQKLEKAELDKAGLSKADLALASLPAAERDKSLAQKKQEQKSLEKQLAELEKKLAELAQKLQNKNLSDSERKKLEAEQKALQQKREELNKELKQNKDAQDALKLSAQAQETLAKLQKNPLYKELQELAKKLKTDAQASKNGRPKLTKEQRDELAKKMEELMKKLSAPGEMDKYLKALMEAIKKGGKLGQCNGLCMGLGVPLPIPGAPGSESAQMLFDTGKINKLDKPVAGGGKTTETQVTGDRQDSGEETYIEIKAPTTVGNRTSVPYKKVLPSYKKKAESALDKQQIPKEHQKRVKEYFDSLNGH